MREETKAAFLALSAAAFYALSIPFSKLLMDAVEPIFMASLLYLGAGTGVGIMYVFHHKKEERCCRLNRRDLPCTIGMILLDILAPIFLMIGIRTSSAASASLLSNFETVSTTLIALVVFKEAVSARLWKAIALVTLSCVMLSFEGTQSFRFSIGSLWVILATICWGLENNCTRRISGKSTYEIVTLKGLCSGGCALMIARAAGERVPDVVHIALVMLLGFVAYGLSIFLYIRAQRTLGAARTSAYYAVAPFIGALLSFVLLGERLTLLFGASAVVMVAGTILVVQDTIL